MNSKNAEKFWLRYKEFGLKDLTVTSKTGIPQSTLSTWKTKNVFPRADNVLKIAQALGTSAEYLVTGHKANNSVLYSAEALKIAEIADRVGLEDLSKIKEYAEFIESKFFQRHPEW